MEKVDLLIKKANEVVTLKGPNKPRVKEEMNELSIVKNGSIAVKNGVIIDVGKNLVYRAEKTINAAGKTVTPGFVDPHTHLVFAGTREFELEMKLQGMSYLEILKKGGGIFYTVEKTRKTTEEQLLLEAKKRLNNMLTHGTTTCEAKSGYGLTTEAELKILRTQKKLNESHPVDIISTFLGAHAIPEGLSSDEYVEIIIKKMLPHAQKLADFCDVFCEKGFFTVEQSKKILTAGKKHGLTPKIHADEIFDTGAAKLAAEINALTADHLLKSSDEGLKMMAKKNVIAVLLPATPFSLMTHKYPPSKKILDLNIPIAIGTDLNPNCWTENMQFIIQLSCFNMGLTPAEALTAATFNAACAIKKEKTIGSIEKGKQADLLVLNCPNHKFIPYHFGVNQVDTVIKKGKIVAKN